MKPVDYCNPLFFYGSYKEGIEKLLFKTLELKEWISEDLKINKAQVVWAVHNEYARQVEDFLSRRTRAILLDAKESIKMTPIVAEIMAKELGYDNSWIKTQVANFTILATGYLLDNSNKRKQHRII